MKKNIYCFLLLVSLFIGKNSFAQSNEDTAYHHLNIITESTGNTGTGANINVIYQRCKWTANPDDATKTLKGNVTIYFKTIEANVSTVNFDFNSNSFNNGNLVVTYHNNATAYTFGMGANTDVININLSSAIVNIGTIDSVNIQYEGTPPAATSNQVGYQRKQDANGNNYIYTLSESYEDKDWFPCKADMQDKIDSVDIMVTCPNAFWVAANGVMTDSADDGTNRTFMFKHRYPIASYLVAIGIAKYKRFYLGNVTSNGKQVPFIVNIFNGKTAATEAAILTRMNNNKLVFEQLSNLYGDYGFANEKHGYYEFGFNGGMEHQTMSGMGSGTLQSNTILAHELGHQWFGDKVTMGTWKHLWLAEGFATYTEALAFEFVPSIGIDPVTKMANNKSTARSNNYTPIAVDDISNSNTIWTSNNTTAVYERACMVIAQLRCLLGDTKFFTALKNYQSDTALAYKSATTADAQRIFENAYGESLSTYFNEWIYKRGTPDYTIEWGNNGTGINIKLAQTVSANGSVGSASTFFPMPIVLKISNAANTQDTTIVIYHKAANVVAYSGNGAGTTVNSNTIFYNLSFVPATITHDPLNRTFATANINFNASLPVQKIDIDSKKNNSETLIQVSIAANEEAQKVELEQSIDGMNFSWIAEMTKVNTTKNNYHYFTNTIESKTYYRAKVYCNNTFSYSKIIVVNGEKKISFIISPNPAKTFVNISFENSSNENFTFNLIDVKGNIVAMVNTQQNFVSLKTAALSSGIYFIDCIKNGTSLSKQKIVVEQ